MVTPSRLDIYTDGAYSSKNDVGGWAFVVSADRLRDGVGKSGAEQHTTNNRMELRAILAALGWVLHRHPAAVNVFIHTDSQYALKVINSTEDNITKNHDLVMTIRRIVRRMRKDHGMHVTLQWVRGHDGDTWNTIADAKANKARNDLVKLLAEQADTA